MASSHRHTALATQTGHLLVWGPAFRQLGRKESGAGAMAATARRLELDGLEEDGKERRGALLSPSSSSSSSHTRKRKFLRVLPGRDEEDDEEVEEADGDGGDEEVEEDPRFTMMASNRRELLGVTSSGSVYAWSLDGVARARRLRFCTGQLPALKHVISHIACGGQFTVAIASSGKVFSWGSGAHGRLGHGDDKDCDAPTLIRVLDDHVASRVACGWSHVALIVDSGDL